MKWFGKRRLFTDKRLLEAIYDVHADEYSRLVVAQPRPQAFFYLPVDFEKVAQKVSSDADTVFFRLHYTLENKYGYKDGAGVQVHLFAYTIGDRFRCINFPYMCSIIAQLNDSERSLFWTQIGVAVALVIGVLGLFFGPG
jgi:hypothetical protein